MEVQGQPRQNCKTLSEKITKAKKRTVEGGSSGRVAYEERGPGFKFKCHQNKIK
jgi:hypothetical protein